MQPVELARERLRDARGLWPSIRRALGIVWEAAPAWTGAWLVLLIVQGLLPVATVYLTKYLVDSLVALIEGEELTPELLRPALLAIMGMVLVMLVTEILRSFTSMVHTAQAELIGDHVSGLVHAKAIEVDIAYYDSPLYYDQLYRAGYESLQRPVNLLRGFGNVLQNSITLVAMAGILLQYGILLPLALLGSSIPALYVMLHQRTLVYEWRKRNTAALRRSGYYDWLLTTRRPSAEMRQFGLGDYFRQAYRVIRTQLREERLDLARKQGWSELIAGVFGLLVLGVALTWMLWQAIQGNVTLGDLALFYQAFNIGQGLMRSLLSNMGDIYGNTLYLADLFSYLDLESHIADPQPLLDAPTELEQGVVFKDVGFCYPGGERPLLEQFNLSVGKGQFVAILGRNGAGKSTLVKLLTRLYEVSDGQITIDGIDIGQLRQADLRHLITVLFQEPVDYNDTVAQNIAFGDLGIAAREDIVAAARAAGAEEIIAKLPQQYETLLGRRFEGGQELSVGEWQRLALARAFLRRAPILILDEPTSAMDPWAEADWLGRLRHETTDRTVILITHRLTTAVHADQIYLMEKGCIVESGSHEQLLALDGRYAAAWHAGKYGTRS